jgi:hypothetical protein
VQAITEGPCIAQSVNVHVYKQRGIFHDEDHRAARRRGCRGEMANAVRLSSRVRLRLKPFLTVLGLLLLWCGFQQKRAYITSA